MCNVPFVYCTADIPQEPSLTDILPNFSKDILQVYKLRLWLSASHATGFMWAGDQRLFAQSYVNSFVARQLW